jgi:hypothetical protein
MELILIKIKILSELIYNYELLMSLYKECLINDYCQYGRVIS